LSRARKQDAVDGITWAVTQLQLIASWMSLVTRGSSLQTGRRLLNSPAFPRRRMQEIPDGLEGRWSNLLRGNCCHSPCVCRPAEASSASRRRAAFVGGGHEKYWRRTAPDNHSEKSDQPRNPFVHSDFQRDYQGLGAERLSAKRKVDLADDGNHATRIRCVHSRATEPCPRCAGGVDLLPVLRHIL